MGFITNRRSGRFAGLELVFDEGSGIISLPTSEEKFVIHDDYSLYYHNKFGKLRVNKRKRNFDDTHKRKLEKLQKLWKSGDNS